MSDPITTLESLRHRGSPETADPKRDMTPAARRALDEAAVRRANADPNGGVAPPSELGGRGGLDPVRYHDWEISGRAVDF